MFIGGLNWETTDDSLREYFEQFGSVTDCMVMRDGATGRSRGFGFLTFADAQSVTTVVTKEHFLDGKIVCNFRTFFFTGKTPVTNYVSLDRSEAGRSEGRTGKDGQDVCRWGAARL